MDRSRQPPHVQAWREILNEHWPSQPRAIKRRDETLPVRVRIVFAGDGETFLDGAAVKWNAEHVWVEVDDRRFQTNGVWLKPPDVYRRAPA